MSGLTHELSRLCYSLTVRCCSPREHTFRLISNFGAAEVYRYHGYRPLRRQYSIGLIVDLTLTTGVGSYLVYSSFSLCTLSGIQGGRAGMIQRGNLSPRPLASTCITGRAQQSVRPQGQPGQIFMRAPQQCTQALLLGRSVGDCLEQRVSRNCAEYS